MLKKKAVFQNPSLWELKWNQVQLSACRSDWTAVGLSPVTSSALSFRNSSKVVKRCLRQWSTRSWIWYSCFYPSTVWKSWTSTPRTVKVSYPWISPSWPTMCPWPSCFSKLGPRRAPTVSKNQITLSVCFQHTSSALIFCSHVSDIPNSSKKLSCVCLYLQRCTKLKRTLIKPRIAQP